MCGAHPEDFQVSALNSAWILRAVVRCMLSNRWTTRGKKDSCSTLWKVDPFRWTAVRAGQRYKGVERGMEMWEWRGGAEGGVRLGAS